MKLNEYLDAVRDVERRIQMAESSRRRASCPRWTSPPGVPEGFVAHAKLMFDLQVLAWQADLTRVTTFMLGHETSNRAYPEIGVPDAHHALSHHGGDRVLIERLKKVDHHLTEMFAYYVDRLAATEDGDRTLLDSAMVMYGSGLSDGNRHNHHDLPTLLVGGAGGRLAGGRHVAVAEDTPNTNLFLAMLDKLGVPIETLGDSSGPGGRAVGVTVAGGVTGMQGRTPRRSLSRARLSPSGVRGRADRGASGPAGHRGRRGRAARRRRRAARWTIGAGRCWRRRPPSMPASPTEPPPCTGPTGTTSTPRVRSSRPEPT